MAFTRRNTTKDATWQRAWTADALADLTTIGSITGTAGPRHGDVAFVTATGLFYLWMDDNTWHSVDGTAASVVIPSPPVFFPEGESDPHIGAPSPSQIRMLGDYSEGSWTPSLTIGGSSVGITYSTQIGKYIRIGRYCLIEAEIHTTNIGGLSGAVLIKGFPFAGGFGEDVGVCDFAGGALLITSTPYVGISTSTDIFLLQMSNASVRTQIQGANLSNVSVLIFTLPCSLSI